jgi:protein-tyrosine phosphatase
MNTFCIDEKGCLFISPRIDDWQFLEDHSITVVIDLEGDLDAGVPTVPNHVLYVYYPIFDEELPDLEKLKAVARLGASLVETGHKVLSHCGMGFNRSALVAGLILVNLGMSGEEAFHLLRRKRPGSLFNEIFASYLRGLPAPTS